MPYTEADETDPNLLVGVVLPGSPESMTEMAYVFAEEFSAMGHDAAQIERMFETPKYGAPYRVFVSLGAERVREIIGEAVQLWGRVRFSVKESAPETEQLVQIAGLRPRND